MRYVRRFNSKRGPRLGSGSALTMPYHAYAPLPHWPVTPSPSPSRVSSVTFPLCVCVCSRKFMQLPGCKQEQQQGEEGKEGRRTGCLAGILFYFICINHVACDAIEKYICLLGNFALAFPCTRPPTRCPLPPLPVQGVQGHGMPRSRTCSRASRRRRLGKCIRFARAVNVKTMAQVFGCQLRKGKCAGKIA